MDLRETGIREQGPPFIGTIRCRDIAGQGIGGKIEDVRISSGTEADRVGCIGIDLSAHHITNRYPFRLALNDNKIKHLRSRMKGD